MDKIIELEAQLEHCDHTIANLREDCAKLRERLEENKAVMTDLVNENDSLRLEYQSQRERLKAAKASAHWWQDIAETETWPFEWQVATKLRAERDALRKQLNRAETIADRCIVGLEDILAKRGAAPLTAIRALKMGKKWQEKRNE